MISKYLYKDAKRKKKKENVRKFKNRWTLRGGKKLTWSKWKAGPKISPELKQNKQTTKFAEAIVSVMEENKTKMQNLGKRWQKSRRDEIVLSELGLKREKNQQRNKKDMRRNKQIDTVENVVKNRIEMKKVKKMR